MDKWIEVLTDEAGLFGSCATAHAVALVCVFITPAYYFAYYLVAKYARSKSMVRNPELEERAYWRKAITRDQLTTKYASNLSATSTMAALSVAMVLLFVVAVVDMELTAYNRLVSLTVCLLMTIASIVMLFAHQLYDAIISPVFEPRRRFKLRHFGSNLNVMAILLFIVSMLLVVSMVGAIVTLISSVACCVVMTLYIERRLVPAEAKEREIDSALSAGGEEQQSN